MSDTPRDTQPLTREEWSNHREILGYISDDRNVIDLDLNEYVGQEGVPAARRRQLLVALLLGSQPFGFTREDVEAIHRIIRQLVSGGVEWNDGIAGWASLADRIEALLPPE